MFYKQVLYWGKSGISNLYKCWLFNARAKESKVPKLYFLIIVLLHQSKLTETTLNHLKTFIAAFQSTKTLCTCTIYAGEDALVGYVRIGPMELILICIMLPFE